MLNLLIDPDSPKLARPFEALELGDAVEETIVLDLSAVQAFSRLAGDHAALHTDEVFALRYGLDRPIAHGLLVASRFSRLLGMFLPGECTVIHKLQVNFHTPAPIDSRIIYRVAVTRLVPSVKTVLLDLTAISGQGVCLIRGTAQCGFLEPAAGREEQT